MRRRYIAMLDDNAFKLGLSRRLFQRHGGDHGRHR